VGRGPRLPETRRERKHALSKGIFHLAGNGTCRKAACALSTLRVRLASITENELQRERNRKV
jgi:hypothetical protein